MVLSTSRLARDRAGAVRNQLDEQSGLPFLEILSASEVESACQAWNHRWRNLISMGSDPNGARIGESHR